MNQQQQLVGRNQRGRGRARALGGGHRGRGRGERRHARPYGLRQVRRPARRYGFDDDAQEDNLQQNNEREEQYEYELEDHDNEPVLEEVPMVVPHGAQEQPQVQPQAQAQDQLVLQPLLQLVTQLLGQQAAPARQEEKRKVKIPDYDGTQCYTHFRAQFIALTSRMTEVEKGQRLLECLKGKSVIVLNMLVQQSKALTYTNLDEILTRTFSMPQSIWQRKRAFEELKQKTEQSLQDYAQDVERIGREYMVTHVESDLQEALVSQFIKGLLDRSAASKLAFAPVDTLQDAVKHLNRGLLLCGEEPPAKKVRLAETTVTEATGDEAVAGPSSAPDDPMSVLVNALKTLTNAKGGKKEAQVRTAQQTAESDQGTQTRGRGRPRGTGRGRGRGNYNNQRGNHNGGHNGNNKGACHYCGKDGHYAYECRRRIREEGNQQEGGHQQGGYQQGGHHQEGYRGNGRGRGGGQRQYAPYFPPEALHHAMAYYQFQQERQNNHGNGGNHGNGNNGNQRNGNQRAIAMPYVPQNDQGN